MSEAAREQLVSPPHSIKHISPLIGQLSLPIMEMVPWKWVRGKAAALLARRHLSLEDFQCFLRQMFGIKNQPRKGKKNIKSQYSSGGLAALPVLPTRRNYLQFVHFTSKPAVSFLSAWPIRGNFPVTAEGHAHFGRLIDCVKWKRRAN